MLLVPSPFASELLDLECAGLPDQFLRNATLVSLVRTTEKDSKALLKNMSKYLCDNVPALCHQMLIYRKHVQKDPNPGQTKYSKVLHRSTQPRLESKSLWRRFFSIEVSLSDSGNLYGLR
jgi:hypothetical protein